MAGNASKATMGAAAGGSPGGPLEAAVTSVRPRVDALVVGPHVVHVNAAGGTHRQCTITISNHSSHSLIKPRMYVSSGSCTRSLPSEISSSMEAMVEFKKTPHTACGAVGVFTYELQKKSHNRKLAFMFSVPYDYGLYSNWHAAGFFDKNKACDHNLFNEMYYNSENGFVRQKGGFLISHSDGDFIVRATMTDTYTPDMTVEIHDNSGVCEWC